MRTIVAVVVAALINAVGACSKNESSKASAGGSGSSAQGPAAWGTAAAPVEPLADGQAPAACALVSDEDMTAALGAAFPRITVRSANINSDASVCQYRKGRILLTVTLEPADRNAYEDAKQGLPGGEEIPALGDAAYFHLAQNERVAVGTLLVLKERTMLTLTYGGFSMDKGKAESDERALAARLAPKL